MPVLLINISVWWWWLLQLEVLCGILVLWRHGWLFICIMRNGVIARYCWTALYSEARDLCRQNVIILLEVFVMLLCRFACESCVWRVVLHRTTPRMVNWMGITFLIVITTLMLMNYFIVIAWLMWVVLELILVLYQIFCLQCYEIVNFDRLFSAIGALGIIGHFSAIIFTLKTSI